VELSGGREEKRNELFCMRRRRRSGDALTLDCFLRGMILFGSCC
jgi:hypothetical protein